MRFFFMGTSSSLSEIKKLSRFDVSLLYLGHVVVELCTRKLPAHVIGWLSHLQSEGLFMPRESSP